MMLIMRQDLPSKIVIEAFCVNLNQKLQLINASLTKKRQYLPNEKNFGILLWN